MEVEGSAGEATGWGWKGRAGLCKGSEWVQPPAALAFPAAAGLSHVAPRARMSCEIHCPLPPIEAHGILGEGGIGNGWKLHWGGREARVSPAGV